MSQGGNVACHDDQRVLQLSVGLGRQLAVDELTGGDDLLTHSVLTAQITLSELAVCFNNFLQPSHLQPNRTDLFGKSNRFLMLPDLDL